MRASSPKAAAVLLAFVLALAPPAPAFAQRLRQPIELSETACREIRNLDPTQYWFWDAYFGVVDVHDLGYERWGRLAMEPTICFRIELALLDDARPRTTGYRIAVAELVQWIGVNDEATPEDDSELALRHLERITGQSLRTRRQWANWWADNGEFVLWSTEAGRLEVAEDARAAGERLLDDAVLLGAEEYWFYAARGWIGESAAAGSLVVGDLRVPPHGYGFRIEAIELHDRLAKQRGYLRALENLLVDGLMMPGLADAERDSVVERLRELTGQDFGTNEGWIDWWKQNQDRLVLSADGDRLVISSERR